MSPHLIFPSREILLIFETEWQTAVKGRAYYSVYYNIRIPQPSFFVHSAKKERLWVSKEND